MSIALGITGLHLKDEKTANSHHSLFRIVDLVGLIDGKRSIGSILVDHPLVARRRITTHREAHRLTSLQWDTILLKLGLESITDVTKSDLDWIML